MMENIYLKEINETDTDILDDYNNDLTNNNCHYWISTYRFPILIQQWKEECNDISKVHFYPYWVMEENQVVGQIVVKTNIEVDDMWKNHGGNISYEIIPSYRNKGYGTICLHLALEKCKELGLTDVLVSCIVANNASRKVI